MMNKLEVLKREYVKAKEEKREFQEKYDRIKNRVLRVGNYVDNDTKERIISCEDDYNMSEKQFETYCKVLFIEQQTEGIYTSHWSIDPTYEYTEKLIKAENNLIVYGLELLRGTPYYAIMINDFDIKRIKHRRKMIDVLLKF